MSGKISRKELNADLNNELDNFANSIAAHLADEAAHASGVGEMLMSHLAETATNDVHGLAFKGAMVTLSTNQSVADSTPTKVAYDTSRYDDLSFFDAVNNRFVIPDGVSKVRLRAQVFWAVNATGYRFAWFKKNGIGNFEGNARDSNNGVSGKDTILSIESTVLRVTPGDYFEVEVSQNSGSALDLVAANIVNYFAVEVVE